MKHRNPLYINEISLHLFTGKPRVFIDIFRNAPLFEKTAVLGYRTDILPCARPRATTPIAGKCASVFSMISADAFDPIDEGGRAGRVKHDSLQPPCPPLSGGLCFLPPCQGGVGGGAPAGLCRPMRGGQFLPSRSEPPFDTPSSSATQGEVDTVAMQDEGRERSWQGRMGGSRRE